MSNGLRVSILGGGSAYTPGLIEGFIRLKDTVPLERLVLMDIDSRKLSIVGAMVKAMLEAEMPGTRVDLTQDRMEAIQDIDFILCQIRVGGLAARHLDESIATELGLVGQETTGPGGFSMALRTIPVMVEIARDIETHNPGAWLINYTNPTGLVAEAIHKACPVKVISICDEPMILQEALAGFVGVDPGSLFMDYFGLNHLGWARRVLLRGNDILPVLRQTMQESSDIDLDKVFGSTVMSDPKNQLELQNTLRIFLETGLLPSPYLQYYYFSDEMIRYRVSTGKTRAQEVIELEKAILADFEKVTAGRKKLEIKRGGKWHADMMIGMLSAIAQDSRSIYIVNVPNRGSMPELPYDKIVEVPAVVDASGAHPLAVGNMPASVRGLVQAVAAYEELTVKAALEGSQADALGALTCHPLVPSREVAKRLLDSYLRTHAEYLPQFAGRH
jgi:6-phospho-beta-glucosidase